MPADAERARLEAERFKQYTDAVIAEDERRCSRRRTCLHESAHAVAARLLDLRVSYLTVAPGRRKRIGGRKPDGYCRVGLFPQAGPTPTLKHRGEGAAHA